MKIRITLAGNDRVAIILPIESAGIAASLLASASVWERDGYGSTSGWKPAEDGIKIEYTDGRELAPTDPMTLKAQQEASEHQQRWYREYTEHNKLKQQFGEMQAALEELRARTVCVADAPKAEPELVAEDEAPTAVSVEYDLPL